MIINTAFPVENLWGSDGNPQGLVYFESNGLQLARKFVVPTQPDTAQQVAARAILTASAQNFKNLTDAQRAGWRTFAGISPVTIHGKTITLQDIACYVRSDWMSYCNETTHLTTAPTALPGFSALDIQAIGYTAGTSTMEIEVEHNGTNGVGYWLVKVTDSLASAQRNPRPSDYRLVKGVAAASIVGVTTSVQTIQIVSPTFTGYTDGDYVGVSVQPIGDDYSVGTVYAEKLAITVV